MEFSQVHRAATTPTCLHLCESDDELLCRYIDCSPAGCKIDQALFSTTRPCRWCHVAVLFFSFFFWNHTWRCIDVPESFIPSVPSLPTGR